MTKKQRRQSHFSILLLLFLNRILLRVGFCFFFPLRQQQELLALTSKWRVKQWKSALSGGQDVLLCTRKLWGFCVARCPPPPLSLSLVCSLSQHSASAPVSLPWPASARRTLLGHHCVHARVCLCEAMLVSVWVCVRVFVGESYCCIYVVRSFHHLMQYDIFHFASNPGYFCLLLRISYCTGAP